MSHLKQGFYNDIRNLLFVLFIQFGYNLLIHCDNIKHTGDAHGFTCACKRLHSKDQITEK